MKKIILTLFFSILLSLGITACKPSEPAADIIVFTQTGCPHCEHAMAYINNMLKKQMPTITVAEYNILASQENKDLFKKYVRQFKIAGSSIGTPLIIVRGTALIGWEKSIQEKIIKVLEQK
ncbi:MAG: glutaredoxin family protein [Alphaproteobacteria bacterium]|nr:glutaredoxin family protein [Alphaproteobacteria bacterium]